MEKFSFREVLDVILYRRPLRVRELMVFKFSHQTDSFYLCPRCHITMEREFMSYCDRCGQCLDWSNYDHARIVYPGC